MKMEIAVKVQHFPPIQVMEELTGSRIPPIVTELLANSTGFHVFPDHKVGRLLTRFPLNSYSHSLDYTQTLIVITRERIPVLYFNGLNHNSRTCSVSLVFWLIFLEECVALWREGGLYIEVRRESLNVGFSDWSTCWRGNEGEFSASDLYFSHSTTFLFLK